MDIKEKIGKYLDKTLNENVVLDAESIIKDMKLIAKRNDMSSGHPLKEYENILIGYGIKTFDDVKELNIDDLANLKKDIENLKKAIHMEDNLYEDTIDKDIEEITKDLQALDYVNDRSDITMNDYKDLKADYQIGFDYSDLKKLDLSDLADLKKELEILKKKYKIKVSGKFPVFENENLNEEIKPLEERIMDLAGIPQKELARILDAKRNTDPQTRDLAIKIYRQLLDRYTLSSDEKEAQNRLALAIEQEQHTDILRNNIFKAAHALGIKLPSSMF